MNWKQTKTSTVLFLLLIAIPLSVYSQDDAGEQLKQTFSDIKIHANLIEQINREKDLAKGTEARALDKQLVLTQKIYRGLLWHFVDDFEQVDQKDEYSQLISAQLQQESKVIRKQIEKNFSDKAELESRIVSGMDNFSIAGQARLPVLKTKLTKKQKALETLLSDLTKNGQKIEKLGEDASQDFAFVTPLITTQADILSGLIGFNKDKLAKLARQLSVVSNKSKKGESLIADIRSQNLLIKTEAKRLESMAGLLENMEVDASLYKKTVIQSVGGFNNKIFDKKVASHLLSQWWLESKKWFFKQAPELFGKAVTFIVILLLAILLAVLIKKMIRRVFARTLPEMSELAKHFIVSMSSKLVFLAGVLLALSNIGMQIGPLLAGLGVMGFIVGFALQDTLSNFASGLMILIYRPYDVGDKIITAGIKGKVSKMNLVSTTIYTSENHQLTIPNKKIWGDMIQNITSQPLHRLDLYFKVPYSADSETVRAAISEVVETCPIVNADKEKSIRIHELGEFDVKYLARFWVDSDDINEAKWTISEGVKKRFDEEGISLNIIESVRG